MVIDTFTLPLLSRFDINTQVEGVACITLTTPVYHDLFIQTYQHRQIRRKKC